MVEIKHDSTENHTLVAAYYCFDVLFFPIAVLVLVTALYSYADLLVSSQFSFTVAFVPVLISSLGCSCFHFLDQNLLCAVNKYEKYKVFLSHKSFADLFVVFRVCPHHIDILLNYTYILIIKVHCVNMAVGIGVFILPV